MPHLRNGVRPLARLLLHLGRAVHLLLGVWRLLSGAWHFLGGAPRPPRRMASPAVMDPLVDLKALLLLVNITLR